MTGKSMPALFPREHVGTVIQDLLDSCQGLKRPARKVRRPEEDLCRQVYRKLVRLPRYRTGPLEPHFESWLSDLRHRSDIRFSCGQGIETYFLIEAKRLFVTFPRGHRKSLVPQYIDDGMMRFISREYAPFQFSSAMLGYVYDETTPVALCRLQKAIDNRKKKLKLAKFSPKSSLAVTPAVAESRHQLSEDEFVLYHLLVNVSKN